VVDADISTADARRLFSFPAAGDDAVLDEPGPHGWTRRRFLQAVGLGLVGGAATGTLAEGFLPDAVRQAFAGTPLGPTDRILVTIMLYGGNDGLNTVVPYADGLYRTQRGALAIAADRVLPLNGQLGLHPSLVTVKSLWDAGQVAVVQGVGYPDPDLSHFSSMATWMHGRFGAGAPTSGWIGRWLDGQPSATAALAAAEIDTSVPLHMVGQQRRAVGIAPSGGMFGAGKEAHERRMFDGLRAMSASPAGRGRWHDMFAASMRSQLDLAVDVAPVFSAGLPSGGLVRKATIAGRLVNANLGLRVIDLGLGGFDHHDGQPSRHAELLAELDAGIGALLATLAPAWRDRVAIMTMSEFGRTPFANGSAGTDHGTANPHLVIGSRVAGGLYGAMPSLVGLRQWDRLAHTVDLRSMFGSVLDGWLGGGGSTVLGGGFEDLRLFRPESAPSGPVVVTPAPVPAPAPAPTAGGGAGGGGAAPSTGFVPCTPLRVFDTRDGTGGRSGALGADETWTVPVAGTGGVPAHAVAVAINLTSVLPSAPTFVTAFPAGGQRPFTASLTPVPGMVVPNLVVGRLGEGGALSFYNRAGAVDLVGDLVGWFVPGDGTQLQALTPARLLDTRDGTGGPAGPVGPGAWIDVQVTGRGGVADDCVAAALNVTVTEPTAASFLTVWPAGEARPLAASVNMAAGQTVPNMVLARVGAGGRVSIYNHAGSSHVVVDVLGGFRTGAPGAFVPVTPVRALDTREGLGAPAAPLGGVPLTLQLAGRAGLPASGVGAVLMNVTAVTPTADTFLTVHPSGEPRPLAANLNAAAGRVVSNAVVGRLGPDGCVTIANHAGAVHVVADVMGWFAS